MPKSNPHFILHLSLMFIVWLMSSWLSKKNKQKKPTRFPNIRFVTEMKCYRKNVCMSATASDSPRCLEKPTISFSLQCTKRGPETRRFISPNSKTLLSVIDFFTVLYVTLNVCHFSSFSHCKNTQTIKQHLQLIVHKGLMKDWETLKT